MDTGVDSSKNVLYEVGEFIGNEIADAVAKSNDDNIDSDSMLE